MHVTFGTIDLITDLIIEYNNCYNNKYPNHLPILHVYELPHYFM